MLVLLDSGPLGQLCNPKMSKSAEAIRSWSRDRLRSGDRLLVPEIADYEVRRELVRSGRVGSVQRLDRVGAGLGFFALTSDSWRLAADLWAEIRNAGKATTADHALDGDVLLAAQAMVLAADGDSVVVATTNPKHLSQLIDARRPDQIP